MLNPKDIAISTEPVEIVVPTSLDISDEEVPPPTLKEEISDEIEMSTTLPNQSDTQNLTHINNKTSLGFTEKEIDQIKFFNTPVKELLEKHRKNQATKSSVDDSMIKKTEEDTKQMAKSPSDTCLYKMKKQQFGYSSLFAAKKALKDMKETLERNIRKLNN